MAAGAGLVAADTVATKLYEVLSAVLQPHAERALVVTDRALQEYLGLNTGIANTPQLFWR